MLCGTKAHCFSRPSWGIVPTSSYFQPFDSTNAHVGLSLHSYPFQSAAIVLRSLFWPAVHTCDTGPLWSTARQSKWKEARRFRNALCWQQGNKAWWFGKTIGCVGMRCWTASLAPWWHEGADVDGHFLPVIIDDRETYQRAWNGTERQSMRVHRRETWSDRWVEWRYYHAKNVSETEAEGVWVALLSYLVTHSLDNAGAVSFPLQVRHSLMHILDAWTFAHGPHALQEKRSLYTNRHVGELLV